MKQAVVAAAMVAMLGACGTGSSGTYMAMHTMRFGAGATPQESQHHALAEAMPAQLATDAVWTGDVRAAKIRVWADDDYRAQNLTWEQGFDEQLAYANAVLTPLLGVQLVADYRAWPHRVAGASLADELAALAQQDPGDGALSVIGLVSSMPLASATFEELGYASVSGRHVVLRGYADLDEHKAVAWQFRDLRPDERAGLLDARRRHKTAAILLHELGHNLGLPHADAVDTIMSALYSHHAATFSEGERTIMLATLATRLPGRERTPAPTAVAIKPAPAPRGGALLAVNLAASGEIVVDGWPATDSELDDALAAAFATDHATEVEITADHRVPFAMVGKIVNRVKSVGLTHVSFRPSEAPP